MQNKKAQAIGLSALPGIAIGFVVTGVVIAVGLAIESDVGDSIGSNDCAGYWNSSSNVCQVNTTNTTALSTNTAAFNASQEAIEGTAELSSKLPLIGLVVGFAVLLGILMQFMRG
jgi:hypothetical protein